MEVSILSMYARFDSTRLDSTRLVIGYLYTGEVLLVGVEDLKRVCMRKNLKSFPLSHSGFLV